MLIVESIRKVRLAYHRDHKPIREIARDFNLSRNTIRKIIRTDSTEFTYERFSPQTKDGTLQCAQLAGCR